MYNNERIYTIRCLCHQLDQLDHNINYYMNQKDDPRLKEYKTAKEHALANLLQLLSCPFKQDEE